MRALFFVLGTLVLFGVWGCGGDQSGEKAAETGGQESSESPAASALLPPSDVTQSPGNEVAVEPVENTPLDGLFIKPYFDADGTVTQLSVKAGQEFSFGVWAETVEPYTTNAAQYSLELPAGVRVLSLREFAARKASIGHYQGSFQIAYECQPSGRFLLVEYFCVADPEFAGGDVNVRPGYDAASNAYLGFSSCDFQHAPAAAGSATLKLK